MGAAGSHCSAATCSGHSCSAARALWGQAATWCVQLEAVWPGEAAFSRGSQSCDGRTEWGARTLQ